jgi:hypothetical protein
MPRTLPIVSLCLFIGGVGWLASSQVLVFADSGSARLDDEATSDAEQGEQPFKIGTKTVMSPLGDDQPLELSPKGDFRPVPNAKTTLFFTTQSHYAGKLSEDLITRVIHAGRAEALQWRLEPAHLKRLRATLTGLDTTLRDVALLIVDEEDRAKIALRKRADRAIHIKTRPPRRDPEFVRVIDAMAKVRFEVGTVWAEPHEGGERHLIVYWKEWPIIKSLHDDRQHILNERRRRVRDWIVVEYRRLGQELFREV